MARKRVDYTLVEHTFAGRLRDWGLSPRLVKEGVKTGYDRLELYRTEIECATAGGPVYVSLEVKAALEHPAFGSAEIFDLITLAGRSANEVIVQCANTYMDVTFPALRSLFEGKEVEEAVSVRLTTYTQRDRTALYWEAYTGQLQVLNDPDGALAARLLDKHPLLLVVNSLAAHLGRRQLHWCKLFAAHWPGLGVELGCNIDGEQWEQAEDEMRAKICEGGDPPPGEWEFRLFLVMRPGREADKKTTGWFRRRMKQIEKQLSCRRQSRRSSITMVRIGD